jgi:hypothetical protein
MDPIQEAYKNLWADLDENELFPSKRPFLAHYTSISTFENIIRNDELWFSVCAKEHDVLESTREYVKLVDQKRRIRS